MEQCKIDLKVQFFFSFMLSIFLIKGANWSSEKCKGGVLMFQGQIGELPPHKLRENGSLSYFTPIFSTHPSQKLGTSTQLKTIFFQINMEQGYSLKKLRLDKLKVTVSISNCKKIVFN